MAKFFLSLLFVATTLIAQAPLTKVSLQLLWLDQFQFAGYYMAKEKGFYEAAGLDVSFHTFKYGMSVKQEVISQRATFGIGRSDLIRFDSLGREISLLAAIFQSTPNVLISLESSGIQSVKDFKGKSFMQTNDLVQSASLNAMLKANNLTMSDLNLVEHSLNFEDLINKKIDIYSGYISNEPYILKKKNIPYRLFSSKETGFDLYSDILFTSQEYVAQNPQTVRNFKNASLLGWEYAFAHIDESVDVILKKYNAQKKERDALVFEAEALRELAYYNTKSLGKITAAKIQRIYDLYRLLSVASEPLNIADLVFESSRTYFSKEERKYLSKRGPISFCTQPDSLPYSAIKNDRFVGIGAELISNIEEKTGLEFELVATRTWEESLRKIALRECDFLPLASPLSGRSQYVDFTKSFYEEPLILVTKESANYIIDIHSIMQSTFSVVKGNSFVETLREEYPNIKLKEVATIQEGFTGVESGKYFAHVDVMMHAAYILQHNENLNLKINGQFAHPVKISFGVRNDDKLLFGILNKVTRNIKLEDLQVILNNWISVHYTKGIEYWYLKELVLVALFVVFSLLYREYILKKKNMQLHILQDKLKEANATLESRVKNAVYELEVAQDIAGLGSWVHDIQNDTLRWSKQTYKMFEVDSEIKEDLFSYFINRVHPDERETLFKTYETALKNRTTYTMQHRLLMPNGSLKYVNERGETLYSEAGEALITHGTVHDVTSKVLAKRELDQKDAYLLHQSRLAQMGEMLSMIAHQWKQPLSAISATQIMLKTTLELEKYELSKESERKEFVLFLDERLDKIALYVQNLSKTIHDFSEYYKPDKQATEIEFDTIVLKANELIKDTLAAKNIVLSFKLQAKCSVRMHENEFMQVILNILNNAKEQLVNKKIEKPCICVSTLLRGDELILEVEDNAGGIPQDIIDNIFDPYFSTKLEKNGTGLGLYMSKMIVNQYHKGTISAKNSFNGAIFTIKLKKEKIDDKRV